MSTVLQVDISGGFSAMTYKADVRVTGMAFSGGSGKEPFAGCWSNLVACKHLEVSLLLSLTAFTLLWEAVPNCRVSSS